MSITEVQLDKKTRQRVKEPQQWKVIFINDDITTVDFVIDVLVDVFAHTLERAEDITTEIHETGLGIAGVYSFEIAETKAAEATALARASNFPLQIKIEST